MLALVAVAAFAASGQPEGTDEIAIGGPTTSPPVSVAADQRPAVAVISGALPNGDRYQVESASLDSTVMGISAGIILEDAGIVLNDGEPGAPTVGIVTFHRAEVGAQASADDESGVVEVVSGDFVLRLSIHDQVRDALGDDAATQVASWIEASDVSHESGLPAFRLAEPLRWATDEEIPLQMQVQYPEFVVQRGCGAAARACTDNSGSQVIAGEDVFYPPPSWPGGSVRITNG